jgi:hypothetical protein
MQTHRRVCPNERASPQALAARVTSSIKKEKVMSKTCGDTARFHRLRKQKIARRARNRALQAEIAARKAATTEKSKPAA